MRNVDYLKPDTLAGLEQTELTSIAVQAYVESENPEGRYSDEKAERRCRTLIEKIGLKMRQSRVNPGEPLEYEGRMGAVEVRQRSGLTRNADPRFSESRIRDLQGHLTPREPAGRGCRMCDAS